MSKYNIERVMSGTEFRLIQQDPDYAQRLFLCHDRSLGYCSILGSGFSHDEDCARAYPPLELYASVDPRYTFHLISKDPPLPEGIKCRIESVLAKELIQLVQTAPTNPIVRTQVHAKVLVPIPDEHVTFEAIKGWIEATIDPATLKPSPGPGGTIAPTRPAPATRDRTNDFSVEVTATSTEYGRARYSVSVSGTGTYSLDEREMNEIINVAIEEGEAGNIDRLIREVGNRLNFCVSDDLPSMEPDDDYEYSDYESNDSGDTDWDTRGPVRDRIRAWLEAHRPDFLNPQPAAAQSEPEDTIF